MPSDPLLPLLDALLRLQNVDAAGLEAILRQVPADSPAPDATTQPTMPLEPIAPPSSANCIELKSPPEELPPARETILVGFGDDDAPLDPEAGDADQWSLPTDEEPTTPPPQVEADPSTDANEPTPVPENPAADLPTPTDAGGSGFEWNALETLPSASKPAVREDVTDRRLRKVMAWAGKGLFVWGLFLASFFLGAWFLRSAPHSELASKTRPATDKSREPADKRRESKSAETETMLAREELIAAEDAQLAMDLATRAGAAHEANAPNIGIDRNGLPKADDGIVVFPQQDAPAQPNFPAEGSSGPMPIVESPPSSPAPAVPPPLPVVFIPAIGGGFGPGSLPRLKNTTTQGGKNYPKQASNSQGNAATSSNQHANCPPSQGQSSSGNHLPQGRTPTTPGHGRSR